MDQLTKSSLECAIAVCRVEPANPGAAQSAQAVFVKRELVLKRGPAACAEVIGRHGLRRRQAVFTDRRSREFAKRLMADAAFIGEEKRKKSVRQFLKD